MTFFHHFFDSKHFLSSVQDGLRRASRTLRVPKRVRPSDLKFDRRGENHLQYDHSGGCDHVQEGDIDSKYCLFQLETVLRVGAWDLMQTLMLLRSYENPHAFFPDHDNAHIQCFVLSGAAQRIDFCVEIQY